MEIKENNTIINFAYKTFEWDNESKGKKASVHCVIIGFSGYKGKKGKKIFDSDNIYAVKNINPYLINIPNVFVNVRGKPICEVPEIRRGSNARDSGNLLLSEEDKNKIINENKIAEKWIKPFVGAEEFLNGKKRWCLWLVDANPSELKKCNSVMERIEKVKKFRLNSKRAATRRLSNIPTLFAGISQPNTNYILIPVTTSGKRKYIPIGFIDKNVIASDATLIIQNANLYHFGVLESIVHMAWMRAISGRLNDSYRYEGTLVYNNFIWPSPTPKQKDAIETAAQAVLDARKLYPNSTLADLYDPNTMPPELTKAHQMNDVAVMEAYGFDWRHMTESDCVAKLMEMYKENAEKIRYVKGGKYCDDRT